MIHLDFNLNNVNFWNNKIIVQNSVVYDIIILNISKLRLDTPIYYIRSKNFCFNDKLKDYTLSYSQNILFLKDISKLKKEIPHLYLDEPDFSDYKYPYDNNTKSDTNDGSITGLIDY